MQLFLNHALRDGYFHADMHQGNLKVGADGAIIAYDFGIMGRIDEYTRRVYAEILMGFIRKDYRRVAEVHFEAGYVPPHHSVDTFAQALRAVGEPVIGRQASQVSMGRLLGQLFEITALFDMHLRPELILLQKTMVSVEGVARRLVLYRCPDGRAFARKTVVERPAAQAPDFDFEDARDGTGQAYHRVGGEARAGSEGGTRHGDLGLCRIHDRLRGLQGGE